MRKLSACLHIIDKISEWSGKTISFAIVLIIAVLIGRAVLRYAFTLPTAWNITAALKILFVYIVIELLDGKPVYQVLVRRIYIGQHKDIRRIETARKVLQ